MNDCIECGKDTGYNAAPVCVTCLDSYDKWVARIFYKGELLGERVTSCQSAALDALDAMLKKQPPSMDIDTFVAPV